MWRDIFLANKDAVLEMLGRFSEDVSELTRAIRRGDGDALFDIFTERRAIRRSIVADGPGFARAGFRPAASGIAGGAAAAAVCRGGVAERRASALMLTPTAHSANREAKMTHRK